MTALARTLLFGGALLLTGCEQFDPPSTAGMTERERASYLAIGQYFDCMRPFVKKAKKGQILTDAQVMEFGYKCRPELENAARLRERYFTAEFTANPVDKSLSAPSRAERVRLHERELAGLFWCDFRTCYQM